MKIAPDGSTTTFATVGLPRGLAFDQVGNLYVADDGSAQSIIKITPSGVQSTFASGLSTPRGLAFDSAGDLYAADIGTNSILKFTPAGVRSTFASGLSTPADIAFDQAGNLFESDRDSGSILKFTPAGVRSTFATGLNVPLGLAFDSAGNLFEVDLGTSSVLKFAPNGARQSFASLTAADAPVRLSVDATDNVYLSDMLGAAGGIIYKYTPAGVRSTFATETDNVGFLAFSRFSGNLPPATFTSVSPARVWDSRFGPGPTGQVGAGQARNITVTGIGGVPATGVSAVVLNVAAVNPSAQTFATVWPTGEFRPLAANLNVPPSDVRANLVVVKVGAGGQVSVFNNAGNVDFVADVAGWYGPGAGDRYTSVSPARVWDTRSGPGPTGRIEAAGSRNVTVTGVGGVPATGVTAVVLNVAAVNPSARTFITAWPAGENRPLAANLNVPAGDVRANLVFVKVGASGQVSFYNNSGDVDLIADVAGYFSPTGSKLHIVSPNRIWDSRSGPGPVGQIGAGGSQNLTVAGAGGVPATGATAVVLNLAAVHPTARTFITGWPAGEARPLAANLNVPAGDVRPNLAVLKIGAGGQVSFFNNAGSVDLVADLAGWYGPPGE